MQDISVDSNMFEVTDSSFVFVQLNSLLVIESNTCDKDRLLFCDKIDFT